MNIESNSPHTLQQAAHAPSTCPSHPLQGGAEEALTLPDSTGSTPSQLAIEKGHRLLGLHLAEYKLRQVRVCERARVLQGACVRACFRERACWLVGV